MSCRYPQGIGSIRTLCRGVWHRTHGESLLCFPSLPSFLPKAGPARAAVRSPTVGRGTSRADETRCLCLIECRLLASGAAILP